MLQAMNRVDLETLTSIDDDFVLWAAEQGETLDGSFTLGRFEAIEQILDSNSADPGQSRSSPSWQNVAGNWARRRGCA